MTLQDAIQVIRQALHSTRSTTDHLFLMRLSEAKALLKRSGLFVPAEVDEILRAGLRAGVGKLAEYTEQLAFKEALQKGAQEGILSGKIPGMLGPLAPIASPLLSIAGMMGAKSPGYASTKSNSMWAAMERRFRRS